MSWYIYFTAGLILGLTVGYVLGMAYAVARYLEGERRIND